MIPWHLSYSWHCRLFAAWVRNWEYGNLHFLKNRHEIEKNLKTVLRFDTIFMYFYSQTDMKD